VSVVFTDRELDIMAVLWEQGPSTAAEVRGALGEQGVDLAYNTVLTLLRILQDKGHVDHREEGRTHRFRAAVKRKEAGASALKRTLGRMFGDSAEALLTELVQDPRLSKKDLKRLRRVVNAQLEWRRSGKRADPGDEDEE
jgi:predicted transcriptional regulator